MRVEGHHYRRLLLTAVGAILCSLLINNSALAEEFVPGELIIKTKSKVLPGVRGGVLGKISAKGISFKASFGRMQMHHLKLASGQNLDQVMQELRQDPEIEFVEPNYILRKSDLSGEPIQPLSYEQMVASLATSGSGSYTQTFAPVEVTEAWAEANRDSSIAPIVAVLDSGVDYRHKVFTQSGGLWINQKEIAGNGVDDDRNGFIDDVNGWNFYANNNSPLDDDGHGTHVAGIVVGLSTDIFSDPISAAKVRVMPLKFLGADGSGDTASAVRAVDYAIMNGARVINASWGGGSYSRSLHEAFSRAYSNGLLLVAASGNFGTNNDQSPIYPASLEIPGLIAVAASTSYDTLASFSNFGPISVHLAAPGVAISSTYPNNTFGYSSGTSMAAPFIAGLAAMLLREAPNLSGYQLKDLLVHSVDTSVSFSGKIYAPGRVNALKAMRSTKGLQNTASVVPAYTPTTPSRALASESSGSSGGGGSGGGCGTISAINGLRNGGPGAGSGSTAVVVILLMMLPLVVWALLRRGLKQGEAAVSAFDMRFAKRVDVSDKVIVKTRTTSFEADMKNISKGGLAFTFTEKKIEVNESVTFVFTSRDGKETMEVVGRIVWTNDKTMAGVQFNSLNDYMQNFFLRTYATSS